MHAASVLAHLARFKPGGPYHAMVVSGVEYVVVDLRPPDIDPNPALSDERLITVSFTAGFDEAVVHAHNAPPKRVRVGG